MLSPDLICNDCLLYAIPPTPNLWIYATPHRISNLNPFADIEIPGFKDLHLKFFYHIPLIPVIVQNDILFQSFPVNVFTLNRSTQVETGNLQKKFNFVKF